MSWPLDIELKNIWLKMVDFAGTQNKLKAQLQNNQRGSPGGWQKASDFLKSINQPPDMVNFFQIIKFKSL